MSNDNDTRACERFATLFTGLARAYGTYEVLRTDGAKRVGRAITHSKPVTAELYAAHLRGEQSLGIVPVNEESLVHFAALDIDEYTSGNVELIARVQKNNLPLVPCRSKSGGCHLFMFFREPLEACGVRAKLKEISDWLGVLGCEIFPKQDRLNNADEFGSWINLPYFGESRYMIDPRTEALVPELEKFLSVAEHMRITGSQLDALMALSKTDVAFRDGPPCLQKLALQKVSAGGRNNAAYQYGIYCRKKLGSLANRESILQELRRINSEYFDPPLTDGELGGVAQSVALEKNFYNCDEQPMAALCNRTLCMTRKYGIGNGETYIDFGPLVKFVIKDDEGQAAGDAVWYQWTLNGKVVSLDEQTISSSRNFARHCHAHIGVFAPVMRQDTWFKFLNQVPTQEVSVPFSAGPTGQFIGHVRDFVRDYGTRYTWDALRDGGVFVDRQAMIAYMSWQDLKRYLGRKSLRDRSDTWAWERLKRYFDAVEGQKTIAGKKVRYWALKITADEVVPEEQRAQDF